MVSFRRIDHAALDWLAEKVATWAPTGMDCLHLSRYCALVVCATFITLGGFLVGLVDDSPESVTTAAAANIIALVFCAVIFWATARARSIMDRKRVGNSPCRNPFRVSLPALFFRYAMVYLLLSEVPALPPLFSLIALCLREAWLLLPLPLLMLVSIPMLPLAAFLMACDILPPPTARRAGAPSAAGAFAAR